MAQASNERSFQIILESNDDDTFSEYWQSQCWYLYDDLLRVLPEGSIKPLTFTGSSKQKADVISVLSTLVVYEITAKFFASVIFETIGHWIEHRPNADIEIKCPDESKIKISKESLSKLKNSFGENPHLSICEALHFLAKKSTE